jgi:hypothetical protein
LGAFFNQYLNTAKAFFAKSFSGLQIESAVTLMVIAKIIAKKKFIADATSFRKNHTLATRQGQ